MTEFPLPLLGGGDHHSRENTKLEEKERNRESRKDEVQSYFQNLISKLNESCFEEYNISGTHGGSLRVKTAIGSLYGAPLKRSDEISVILEPYTGVDLPEEFHEWNIRSKQYGWRSERMTVEAYFSLLLKYQPH